MRINCKIITRIRTRLAVQLRLTAISSILGLILTQTGNPQQIVDPPMVRLNFQCPTHVMAPGQLMTLSANVVGAKEILGEEKAKLISYHWEVTGGKIIAGQGTSKVVFDASQLPSKGVGTLDVRIILKGVPPELDQDRTCRLKMDTSCPLPVLFDQYQEISLKEEQPHLNRLGKYLTNEGSKNTAFIVAYAGWKHCFREAEWRANRAKKYLLDKYKIEADRVITIDGGFRDDLTIDIFIAQHGNCGPFPTPKISRDRYFTGSCKDKYKEINEQ